MKTQMTTQSRSYGVPLRFQMRHGWIMIVCMILACLTQIGCVTATVFAPLLPISIPLLVYGSANLSRGPQTATLGLFMGTENLEYDATQNQIPITSENCERMGVTEDDILDFNDHYDSNQAILRRLQENLIAAEQSLKKKGYLFFSHLQDRVQDLNQDVELGAIAQEYGFIDAAHLVDSIQQNMLSKDVMTQIAGTQGVSSATIQILLSIATHIKFEK